MYIWQLELTNNFELVSSSGDLKVKIWRIEDNKLKHLKDLGQHDYQAFNFLIRDTKMVCGAQGGLKKFDINTGESIDTFKTKYNIICR